MPPPAAHGAGADTETGLGTMGETTSSSSTGAASRPPTLLKKLVRERGCQSYRRFCKEYDRTALSLGDAFRSTRPSEATYKRWIAGQLVKAPRTEPSAVLEAMFPGHTVEELFAPYREPSSAINTLPDDTSGEVREVDDVNRKQFLTALGITAVAPGAMLLGQATARIGLSDVNRYRADLARLYELDDHYGATNEVYSLTVRSMRDILHLLETASYSSDVGNQLSALGGELMEHAGWLAFDAGHRQHARYWWLEALHTARMGENADVEALVLASMSYAANNAAQGRETVDLATKAARVARQGRSTPRLQSLLAAREAAGFAKLGRFAETFKALGRAEAELEHGSHDDDPMWLSFWGHSDLACLASGAALRAGDDEFAERSARDAVAAVDEVRFPRNRVSYQADLGAVLARRDLDEALPVIADAAVRAASLNSIRVNSRIKNVVGDLHRKHGEVQGVRELVDWTRMHLPAKVELPAVGSA